MLNRITALVAVVALFACPAKREQPPKKDDSPRLVIHRITVQDRTVQPLKVPGLDEARLLGWMRADLESSKIIELTTRATKGSYSLQMDLGIGRSDEGAEEGEEEGRIVLASARAAAADDIEGITLQASAAVPMSSKADRAQQMAKVKQVVRSVVRDLIYQARLAVGPERELVEALKGKEVHLLTAAVEIAAVRRAKSSVPELIRLLAHGDERVSDRAIGALVAIGDRRAVRPLTRLSKFSDTARMAKIIDGIGALGGQEAKEYLEFVATGHEDADIRNLATEAIERMQRRPGPGSTEP